MKDSLSSLKGATLHLIFFKKNLMILKLSCIFLKIKDLRNVKKVQLKKKFYLELDKPINLMNPYLKKDGTQILKLIHNKLKKKYISQFKEKINNKLFLNLLRLYKLLNI